ncbi:hypothetical protein VC83_08263 [Pseudogymnoascus destructans]|uniref:Aminoglycoside phosphotransferase domain-containing protein n=2 Tax=Pseudogymnoascus destructans TaxID=655981 RepID=L8G4W7_PSED2|nr:uncharacterized protein VC83_08263 [Pseudogymnoascus destructans]ELR07874.1 hypothetical protein GMDG_02756 [Pseudogymnoascus destructans 20631-21]OAF55463.1 hypothetical protein VC83_08263 [Pseudogymnoascus destructans]
MDRAIRCDRPLQYVVPSESKPINDTYLHRFLVLALIKLLKHFRPRNGGIIFLTNNICVKYGPLTSLSEASTMQFIRQHTSIPVPRIICSFTHKGRAYIVMERIHGDMIGRGWTSRADESKAKILSQLKDMVADMRKIAPPNLAVSNVDGGILYDSRIYGPMRFGPFKNIRDFHKHLRGGLETHVDNPDDVSSLIAWQDRPFPAPVFTHGDLSSLNILARGDEVVGIIDWETAGLYPVYWEYTTASHVNPQNLFWKEEVDRFLEPMPKELAMEEIRQKYFGDV